VSKRTRKSVRASCDRLWAQLVKARAGGRCERCETAGRLEAHHCMGRTDMRLRFEVRNGVALHHQCHRWAEQFPLEFAEWFVATRPDDVRFLAEQRRAGLLPPRTLQDYLDLETELTSLLDEIAEAA
jgi:hypothetical protein